jgi:hypothetical protein
MNSRENFLTGLFRLLEANEVPYCVLRNYENIFTDDSSDIDLILEKRHLAGFTESLHAAAAAADHRFVHGARYTNFSQVFWNTQSEFVRIDFESEIRWRIFPILSARCILEFKQRCDCFFVPHPRHESVILFVQAIWRGSLSERYYQQLIRLYAACVDKEELRRTYREAFGSIGDNLAEFHSRISKVEFDTVFCSRLKRSLIGKASTRPASLGALIGNVYDDSHRLWERLRKPAGISLLFASSAAAGKNFDDLMRKIEFLFPAQKCFIQTIDLTNVTIIAKKWDLGLKLRRLRTLFKGGLFVRHYQLARDTDLGKIIKTHPRHLYPSRAFLCMEDSRQRACLAHGGTGFMTDSAANESDGKNDSSTFLIQFISSVLEKEKQPQQTADRPRGTFAVLIGLDGSGKTTLARNLCRLTSAGARFDGVCYYHWRPKLWNRSEFPLPEFSETPRKEPLRKTWFNSLLSCLRLLKNVLLTNLAWHLRVRWLARRNHLVLIDRYYYNYHLDPDSVKYVGPQWLLKLLLPLFPKPDLIITLNAGAETLLARKRELSAEQIARQIAIKDNLDFQGTPCVAVDAREPALRVAEMALAAMTAPSANGASSPLARPATGRR